MISFFDQPRKWLTDIAIKFEKENTKEETSSIYSDISTQINQIFLCNQGLVSQVPVFDFDKFNPEKLYSLQLMVVHDNFGQDYVPLYVLNDGVKSWNFYGDVNVEGDYGPWSEVKVVQCCTIPNVNNTETNEETNKNIIIKIYDGSSFKVNSLIKVIGFVEECGDLVVHSLHCTEIQTTDLLHSEFNVDSRNQVIKYLEECFGDKLVSKLFLIYLMSQVNYNGIHKVGDFPLNMIGVNPLVLSHLLSTLTPQSLLVPLTVEELNSKPFTSVYEEKLNRGRLQCNNGTFLLLDETKLEPGLLREQGLKNISTLQRLVATQTLGVDFSYEVSLDMDIPVVVVSEGKSLFKINNWVRTTAAGNICTSDNVDEIKSFINHARSTVVVWNDDDVKTFEDYFVNQRQIDDKYSIQDFNRQLLIFKLLLKSYAKTGMDQAVWKESIDLFDEWKNRCSQ